MDKNDKDILVLSKVNIIDGTGSSPKMGTIVIQGKHIRKIYSPGTTPELPEKATVIKLPGVTVMPGLIDTHTHVSMSKGDTELSNLKESVPFKTLKACKNAETTLKSGITTIRDLGADHFIDLAVRDAINQNITKGPRMLVSGFRILPTGADYPLYPPQVSFAERFTMDSPDEIRKAARTLLAHGVDVIKILTSGRTFRKTSSPDSYALSLEEAQTAVREAHNQGIPVSCHAHGANGVKIAIASDCDTIEHGTILDDNDIESMAEKQIFLIPTFSYSKHIEEKGRDCGIPDYAVEKALSSRKKRLTSFGKALKAGVPYAMGSDAGMPLVDHGTNAFELSALVDAGLTPMQAIMAGTSCAARCLRLEKKIGTIEEGKLADLLVVQGDPLKGIALLQETKNILYVIKEGHIEIERTPQRTSCLTKRPPCE
jgi:imidazolonepropionase-like amidohydrolase